MADPATVGLVANILGRIFDKKKVASKTNAATVAAAGGGYGAYELIQSGDPVIQLVGFVVGAISTGLLLYKEKSK